MAFSATDVTAVRALPVALAVGPDGSWQCESGFMELVFQSTAADRYHQAYVDGRLAGVTLSTDDRALIVPLAEQAVSLVEVIAVDPADRLTDFSSLLTGYDRALGSRVELSWAGGRYLDDHLDHFDVYGGPAGSINYAAPLNDEPIPAAAPDRDPSGFGLGGYGRGGWGRSAAAFTFITAKLTPGPWSFEVVSVDAAGNAAGGPAARIDVSVTALPRPPADAAVAHYDPLTQTARLTWIPSADLAEL